MTYTPSELLNETLISLKQAAAMMHVDYSSVTRYVQAGLKNKATGQLVRLEHVRSGGKLLTSREAVKRFADRMTSAEKIVESVPVASIDASGANCDESVRWLKSKGF